MDAQTRIGIYAQGYRYRLMDVLKIEFPKLYYLLGDEAFDYLALQYIEAYPSDHYSVRYFGRFLANFIRSLDYHPALSELACFEWFLGETLDAADAIAMTWDDLQQCPQDQWPQLCFSLHPSCRLITLDYPVPQLWRQLADTQIEQVDCPEAAEKPMDWLLWRDGLQGFFVSVNPSTAAISYQLLASSNKADAKPVTALPCFAELCDVASQYMPEEDVPVWMLQWLQFCIQKKILVRQS